MSIAAALERLYGDRATAGCIVHRRDIPARKARYASLPPELASGIRRGLESNGLGQLYTHQAEAARAALDGKDVVVVTPTASGKTMCYALPILQSLAERPDARALLVYPTKALAHDQMNELARLARAVGVDLCVRSYDGDTPLAARAEIRRQARVLVTNPDMLHVSILPNHPLWRDFLSGLSWVIIDEMHSYRGVFGSHVTNVLRRLERISRFYGNEPRYVCTSATIANPLSLAKRLTERDPVLIGDNGAPSGVRHVLLYNPPLLNTTLGIRRSALIDARILARTLLDEDLQTVVFCQSRGEAEQLLIELRQDMLRAGGAVAEVRGYRGGYLPGERREIEDGLRSGAVRCVVATNALELGVNIGGMAACVLVGYPGSVASTWQRIGRAGRGLEDSLAVLIATASPLDQYIIGQPDYLFAQAPEQALVNPDNLHVLLSHVRCASQELPFSLDEAFGGEDVQQILAYLEALGEVRRSRTRWHRVASDFPATSVSLRSSGPERITILTSTVSGAESVIGTVDRETAPVYVFEGAIYLHEGRQYLVEQLDWDRGLAHVVPTEVDYLTRAGGTSTIRVVETHAELERGGHALHRGTVEVTRRVTSYRRLRIGSLETIGWGEVNLPEQVLRTEAMWLTLSDVFVRQLSAEVGWVGEMAFSRGPDWPEQRRKALDRDGYACRWCGATDAPGRTLQVHHIRPYSTFGEPFVGATSANANELSNLVTLCPSCHRLAEQSVAVRGSLAGFGYAVRHLLPTILLCDPGDVGVLTDPHSSQTGEATLFIYDDLPGGVGLSRQAMKQFDELVTKVSTLIASCPCAHGCPSCIGPVLDGDAPAKVRVGALAARLAAAAATSGKQ